MALRLCRCGRYCPQAPGYDAATEPHIKPPTAQETILKFTKHSLLRDKIEEAVETDRMVTTLMGDDVEPRRDFIETNALRDGNMDA
jgi:DNA gyrase subunit B